MSRPVLDPAAISPGVSHTVHYRLLDDRIRAFGFVADESVLQPADLLLVSGDGSKMSRWIDSAQRHGGFEAEHARWTHVAMYIGGDRVVEASPSTGVRVNRLSTVMFRRSALMRRVSIGALSVERRLQVIIHAMHELGQPYSVAGAATLGWHALRRHLWRRRPGADDQSLTICSSFVRRAYLSAAEFNISPSVTDVTWPADLSRSDRLEDISVGWVRVAR